MNILSFRAYHRWVAPTLKVLKSKKNNLPERPPCARKSFIEWNYNSEVYAFGKRLGENFNIDLLKRALTEKSYVEQEERKQKEVGMEPEILLESNEELAHKGEQFMNMFIAKYLKESLPKLPASYRNRLQNFLMSVETLAHISKHIGIDDILLIPDDFPHPENLSRGLKAVTQALENTARAERLVRDLVISQLCGYDLTKLTTPEKPMEELNEALRKLETTLPEYRLIAESGINTLLPVYQVGVYSDKQYLGKGFGESIAIAKEMAACDVLWKMWGISRRKPFHMDLEPPKPFLPSSPVIDITTSQMENITVEPSRKPQPS